MTPLEQALQFELDRTREALDAIITGLFTEQDGVIHFVGGAVAVPLDPDDEDLIIDGINLVTDRDDTDEL